MLVPGTVLELGNHTVEVTASPAQTGDRYRLRIVAQPGGGPGVGSDAHVHPELTETFVCRRGRMLATCGRATRPLPVGATLEVPPATAHGFLDDGDGDLVVDTEVVFGPDGVRAEADLLRFAGLVLRALAPIGRWRGPPARFPEYEGPPGGP